MRVSYSPACSATRAAASEADGHNPALVFRPRSRRSVKRRHLSSQRVQAMTSDFYTATFGVLQTEIEAEMHAVRAAQREVAPLLWEMIDHHFDWKAPQTAASGVGHGKKVRPVLMALVARAICGAHQHVLPAGAALELLHNFTLVHDDVMDHSPTRRHRPTVWALWGATQAINAGDALYALANLALGRLVERGVTAERVVRAFRTLSQACLWTAEGQVLDIAFTERPTVTTAEYMTMVEHKTGKLLEAATMLGALLSTDDEDVIQAYARFGRDLGIAFQIRDDYLGIWGRADETGKPITEDIREKKKSYPVLVALERAEKGDRLTLQRIYAQETLSETDVHAVLSILEYTGAPTQTGRVAEAHYIAALQHLETTGIDNPTQEQIRRLAAFLILRDY